MAHEERLELGLQQAHLPALLMAIVHLEGNASVLDDFPRPVYDFFAEGRLGGYSEAQQAAIRARAKEAIETYLVNGRKLPPPPSQATVRRMMNFVAGADIPEHYVPFMEEELGLTGEEVYDFPGLTSMLKDKFANGRTITVKATAADGTVKQFNVVVRIDTPQEIGYFEHGGILQYVLRQLAAK